MKKIIVLLLAASITISLLAGCGNHTPEPTDDNSANDTLVVGTQNFDGKFSPFFYTNAYENDVLSLERQ